MMASFRSGRKFAVVSMLLMALAAMTACSSEEVTAEANEVSNEVQTADEIQTEEVQTEDAEEREESAFGDLLADITEETGQNNFPAFDTSGQIDEIVLYEGNGVNITATGLVYTDESVDLMLSVENDTGQNIAILNAFAADGTPFEIAVNDFIFYSYSLGIEGEGADVPTGHTDLALSISLEDLLWSGITSVAYLETELSVYESSFDNGLGGVLAEVEFGVPTQLAEEYDFDADPFQEVILNETGEEAFGYVILASSTDIYSDDGSYHAISAALIEEEDGALTLLAEFDETAGGIGKWNALYLNGISTQEFGGAWQSFRVTINPPEGRNVVYRIGISKEDREAYDLEEIETASLVLYMEDIAVLTLTVDAADE